MVLFSSPKVAHFFSPVPPYDGSDRLRKKQRTDTPVQALLLAFLERPSRLGTMLLGGAIGPGSTTVRCLRSPVTPPTRAGMPPPVAERRDRCSRPASFNCPGNSN